MPTQVIMPALEMAQDAGKILKWLKREGDAVKKGEPLLEIETDKAAVEIEATADGVLSNVTAHEGDVIPVAQIIAWILAPGEQGLRGFRNLEGLSVSPVARKVAEEHGVDLARVNAKGARIEKADVLAHLTQPHPLTPSPEILQERGEGARAARGRRPCASRRAAGRNWPDWL